MYQTDQATAAASLPTPAAAGTQGFFTNGNPATGVAATILDADFMNMLMMELANIVTSAGLTLSKTTYNQVLAAIKRIGQNTLVLADTGTVNAYTASNATPLIAGTWVDGVVQAVKIAHTNTGASTYAPDGLTAIPIYGLGLQPLQGSELLLNGTAILMHATIAGVNSGNPICVLMECAGGTQQVPALYASGKINGTNNPNLLFNSSGEFGATGWTLGSFSQFVDTSGEIGSFFSNSGALAAYTFAVACQQVPIGAGQNVCLSMDVSNGASGTVQISLAAYTSGGSYISNIGTLSVPNSSLTRYSTTAQTPTNTAYVVPQLVMNGVTSSAFGIVFRRIKVEQGTTPSLYSQEANWAALGTGPNAAPIFVGAASASAHAVQLGQFVNSFVANGGYAKLPNGLIVQWGLAVSGSGGNVNVTFPIAFPNGFLRVIPGTASGNYVIGLGTATSTVVGMIAYLASSGVGTSGINIVWVALGY
ncbi:gp53-like domain-containing protein [Paraburkholderia bryophila]|uniref:Putative tail fiber protein gp53-like C-terminal domain-containing protein n=1 Tax=Paraburkholderia bryophila TaxID=420952 RepID=A0A7Y9WJK2_9BURK|nr:hypothetical protein [Paraburkholderia bryophila]NYH21376.1 hypothetical protein [Paraburkholderia bryophila]